MNKKFLFFILALGVTTILSGCTKYSTSIEVTKKDEVILTQKSMVSADLLKAIDSDFDDKNPHARLDRIFNNKLENNYREKKFNVINIRDENYIGRQFSKKYKHAKYFFSDNLPPGYMMATNSDLPVDIKKYPFEAIYTINLKFDPQKLKTAANDIYKLEKSVKISEIRENNRVENTEHAEMEEYDGAEKKPVEMSDEEKRYLEIKQQLENPAIMDLTIKIPQEASENNATTVDSATNTYIWKLSEMEKVKNGESVEILLKYKKTNYFSIVISILILISTIIIFNKNKKYTENESDETKKAF